MEFLKSLNVWQKRAIAGYAYSYYIGCMSGACPVTNNPYISTIYGTSAGVLLVNSRNKSQEKENGNDNATTAS